MSFSTLRETFVIHQMKRSFKKKNNFSSYILTGINFYLFTNFGKNYQSTFVEKVSSGMWEMCPKILGGDEYQKQKKGYPKQGDRPYFF